MTGLFINSSITGLFINSSITGLFINSFITGLFINSSITGLFINSSITGLFIYSSIKDLFISVRLYLVNNQCSENYVRNETSADALHESKIMLLNLHPQDVAVQLCERDFQLFRDIEQTEYVDDLFGCKSKFGTRNLTRFTNVSADQIRYFCYFFAFKAII